MKANTQSGRIINWGASVLFYILMCSQTGCATLDMRFANYPDEVKSTFPSTRRVYRVIECYSREDPPNLSGKGTIFIMESIYIYYPLVELPTAIITDFLLWPVDFYFVSKNNSESCNKRAIEP
jgi:hypothetical protein